MGTINGHDYFADSEGNGERYGSVIPQVGRLRGENGGGRPEANSPHSPQLEGRPPFFDECPGSDFGFYAVDVGSEPREEAREMLLETRGCAARLEELDEEGDGPAASSEMPATGPQTTGPQTTGPQTTGPQAADLQSARMQAAIEELRRQVRTIIDMARCVEEQLKTLLESGGEAESGERKAESRGDDVDDVGVTGLRPVPSQPSLAAGRLPNASASGNVDGDAARGGGETRIDEQVTAEEHWPQPSGTHDDPTTTHHSPLTPRRSRKLTPARQAEVVHYIQAGLSLRQAAAFVGCHHSTISKAAQRDPEFAWKLEQAEAIGDALPLVRVIRASRQSWRAAAWLVKNHQPCKALRRERAAERDAETAESLARLERLVREQSPNAELKAVVRGGSVSVEVRPRG
jgi:hypothetical protein